MTTLNYGYKRINKGTHMLELRFINGLRYAKMYPITKKQEPIAIEEPIVTEVEEELEVPSFMR